MFERIYVLKVVCLLFCLFDNYETTPAEDIATVKSQYKEPMIIFLKGVNTKRDLSICRPNQPNMACSVVHQRFWFSPLVIHFCRCPLSDCPWEWQDNDDHTMYINPRAQLKFCKPIQTLPKCKPNSLALTSTLDVAVNGYEEQMLIAHCFCDNFSYFQKVEHHTFYQDNTTLVTRQEYQCKALSKCGTGQFCGHIIERLYQTYYVCSCPQHHLCLMENRNFHPATEVLFNGGAYRGTCTPWIQPNVPSSS